MKLNVKALGISFAILWAIAFLVMGIANLIWPTYASSVLVLLASIYPGYDAAPNLGEVIVGTLYAAFDGAIGGLLFGWIYNAFVPGG